MSSKRTRKNDTMKRKAKQVLRVQLGKKFRRECARLDENTTNIDEIEESEENRELDVFKFVYAFKPKSVLNCTRPASVSIDRREDETLAHLRFETVSKEDSTEIKQVVHMRGIVEKCSALDFILEETDRKGHYVLRPQYGSVKNIQMVQNMNDSVSTTALVSPFAVADPSKVASRRQTTRKNMKLQRKNASRREERKNSTRRKPRKTRMIRRVDRLGDFPSHSLGFESALSGPASGHMMKGVSESDSDDDDPE